MTDRELFLNEIKAVKVIIQSNRAQGAFSEGYLIGQESVLEHFEKFIDSLQEEPKTDWLQELQEKLDSLSKEEFKELWAKYELHEEEPVSMWHDGSEKPKPNMELICIGQYGNPLVLSSNSDSFKSRDISKWAYFSDLLNLSNVQRTTKNRKEPASEDLKTELNKYIEDNFTIDREVLIRLGIVEKDYMYSLDKSDMLALVEHFTTGRKNYESK